MQKIKQEREESHKQAIELMKNHQRGSPLNKFDNATTSAIPLFKKLEKRGLEMEQEENQRIKQQLDQIALIRGAPIKRAELLEHSKRITEIVKEKIEKRKKDRIGRQSAISYDFSKYHNQFHDMVSKEEKAYREMEQKKEEERKKLK